MSCLSGAPHVPEVKLVTRARMNNAMTVMIIVKRPGPESEFYVHEDEGKGGAPCVCGGGDIHAWGNKARRSAARIGPVAPSRGVKYWGLVACA